MNTDKKLREIVRDYANELHRVANGELYKAMDGEYTDYPEDSEGNEREQVSIYDWLNKNGLGDTRYEINGEKECTGGKTLLCFGGPNVWLHDCEVIGYWGGKCERWELSQDARKIVMDFFTESWEMMK